MKQAILFPTVILLLISMFGQFSVSASTTKSLNDSTLTPPKGTVIKNGQLHLRDGYHIRFSEDKKIGTIYKDNNVNVVTASVKCGCYGSAGKCSISTAGTVLLCSGEECCTMVVTRSTQNLAITTKSGSADDGNIIWKVLVIPKTKVTTTSN